MLASAELLFSRDEAVSQLPGGPSQQITPSPADLVYLPPCTSSATTTGQPVPSPSLVRLSLVTFQETKPGCCTTSSGGLSRCCSLPVRLHCPLTTAANSTWIHRPSSRHSGHRLIPAVKAD